MKRILPVFLIAMVLAGSGATCRQSPAKVATNSFLSIGEATDGAVKAYLGLVTRGNLPTNDVPKVMQSYTAFQAVWNASLSAVNWQPTNAAPLEVIAAQTKTLGLIEAARAPPK